MSASQSGPQVFLESASQTGSSPKRSTKMSTNMRVFAARCRLGFALNVDAIASMTSISETTPFQMASRRGQAAPLSVHASAPPPSTIST